MHALRNRFHAAALLLAGCTSRGRRTGRLLPAIGDLNVAHLSSVRSCQLATARQGRDNDGFLEQVD